ncbi:protein TonB [Noviherbaspirillum humi]|uniref:Protein TonB n=1 Tax=Noviherbaspirillum humi TaxID=1688639 RepID=A0A239BX40_9BURK|nr:hypothetical protein [Noviherbaspirillum humi]SNS12212.1 protein TonB [Noviherbaspirillum humi]
MKPLLLTKTIRPIHGLLLAGAVAALAGCASTHPGALIPVGSQSAGYDRAETDRNAVSTAMTAESYKRDLAQRISQVNSTRVYLDRPQALLRSVIVVKYAVDSHGNLVRSEIQRSNRDRETESIALASLRNSAPFPKPASHLMRGGRVELSETWLFNSDGRFQLRSIALAQMDQ